MNMTLVISSLSRGGAERAMVAAADHWAAKGHRVTLVTFAAPEPGEYSLSPAVRRVALGLARPSAGPWQAMCHNSARVRALRAVLRSSRPDVVVSFMETPSVLAVLAAAGLRVPVVVMEHTDPTQNPVARPWELMRRLTYPRAAAVVVLTERLRPWAARTARRAPVFVLPNPLWVRPENVPPRGERQGHRLVASGRMVPLKGFDVLLDAFARVAPAHPDWSLLVLGDGPERPRLEAQAARLGLSGRVAMPGQVADPLPLLAGSDLFVMSSRYEGLPMALLEALACGLPAVSFDCPTGPREVIRDGVDGVLVAAGDGAALSGALGRLMGDGAARAALAARAAEVQGRFGMDRVMDLWEDVFRRVLPSAREVHTMEGTIPCA